MDDQRLIRVELWRWHRYRDGWRGLWKEGKAPTYENDEVEAEVRTFLDAESLAEELDRRAAEKDQLAKRETTKGWARLYRIERDTFREVATLVREGGDG